MQSSPTQIYDTFNYSTTQLPSNWLARAGLSNQTSSFCSLPQAKQPAWYFSSPETAGRTLTTRDVSVPTNGSILQFKLVISCGSPRGVPGVPVVLKYSKDLGYSFQDVVNECRLGQSSCSPYSYSSSYYSRFYPTWTRVTISLAFLEGHSNVRFQWKQAASSSADAWAIDDVYIGSACSSLSNCSGHGDCTPSGCVCDHGFSGDGCQYSSGLPTFTKDSFEDSIGSQWTVVGGAIGSGCGVLASGSSLYFSGGSQRMILSPTLDLTDGR